jgi:glyoxylase-like metal-dependent hydrolase (beta-lactamase superfamily II)
MEKNGLRLLTERISYLPASNDPLSADVGLVRGDGAWWIFDAGACGEAARLIERLPGEKNVVLSHFHQDHAGNLGRIVCSRLYCGDFTKKKLRAGIPVTKPLTFDDGIKLTIFPLPSTHVRGALGLAAGEEYVFLGDALYGEQKQGREAYNVNTLRDMITALTALPAKYFLLSHDPDFAVPREKALARLEALYQKRVSGEAYVCEEE